MFQRRPQYSVPAKHHALDEEHQKRVKKMYTEGFMDVNKGRAMAMVRILDVESVVLMPGAILHSSSSSLLIGIPGPDGAGHVGQRRGAPQGV